VHLKIDQTSQQLYYLLKDCGIHYLMRISISVILMIIFRIHRCMVSKYLCVSHYFMLTGDMQAVCFYLIGFCAPQFMPKLGFLVMAASTTTLALLGARRYSLAHILCNRVLLKTLPRYFSVAGYKYTCNDRVRFCSLIVVVFHACFFSL
jgi:hypothetical protein